MINFLLDWGTITLTVTLTTLVGFVGVLISSLIRSTLVGALTVIGMPLVFILSLFCSAGVEIASAPQFRENNNIFKELMSRYDIHVNNPYTLGFHLCNISDYKSQICKDYIEYFINGELAYKKMLEQREQKKVDEKNKLEKNIEQVLSEIGLR